MWLGHISTPEQLTFDGAVAVKLGQRLSAEVTVLAFQFLSVLVTLHTSFVHQIDAIFQDFVLVPQLLQFFDFLHFEFLRLTRLIMFKALLNKSLRT